MWDADVLGNGLRGCATVLASLFVYSLLTDVWLITLRYFRMEPLEEDSFQFSGIYNEDYT